MIYSAKKILWDLKIKKPPLERNGFTAHSIDEFAAIGSFVYLPPMAVLIILTESKCALSSGKVLAAKVCTSLSL